jgi:hydroxysqualene synthase
MNGTLDRAYRYCEWMAAHHYENFPVASRFLPKRIRPHVAAVYAFARAADDFADETRFCGRSLELLQQWRKSLWDSCDGGVPSTGPAAGELPPPSVLGPSTKSGLAGAAAASSPAAPVPSVHPIFLALSHTVRECGLPVQWLDDLLTAFAMDVTQRRYADWEDLLTYCRYSANPVGRLVLALFGIRDPHLDRLSDCICTGLQLANHWQDLRRDLRRGMLYIPQRLLQEFRVTEGELQGYLQPAATERSLQYRRLMKELVQRARRLFQEGEDLPNRVSAGGLRLELRLTLLGGRAILDRIEASSYDVFGHRPVLSRADKIRLLIRAALPR